MGSGASASKDAPHLAEYFKKLSEKTLQSQDQAMEAGFDMLMGNGEKIKKMKEDMAKWYDSEGKAILTKSFQHHDKDKSGSLENAEAKVFFLNLIQNQEEFTDAVTQAAANKQIEASLQMMKMMMDPKDAKKLEKQTKAELKKQLDAQKKDRASRIANYKNNKDAYDEKAFKVMDTSEDGKIQMSEFLDTFAPESSKQMDLMVALGFMTEQERLQQEQMKKMAEGGGLAGLMEKGEGDGGCEQQ